MMYQEGHNITFVVFLPKIYNPDLVRRKHEINPNSWDTLQYN